MDLRRFTLYTLLGNLPWTIGLAWAGYALGEHWRSLERFIQPLAIALAIAAPERPRLVDREAASARTPVEPTEKLH